MEKDHAIGEFFRQMRVVCDDDRSFMKLFLEPQD